MLTTIGRFYLFLSSYTFLFLIILLKIFENIFSDNDNTIYLIENTLKFKVIKEIQNDKNLILLWGVAIVLLLAVLIGILMIKILIKTCEKKSEEGIEIKRIEKTEGIEISYIFTYMIPLIGINYKTSVDFCIIFIILLFIGVIYTNSNLIFINPMFSFWGYKVYKIIDKNENEIIFISNIKIQKLRNEIKDKREVKMLELSYLVYFTKEKKGGGN